MCPICLAEKNQILQKALDGRLSFCLTHKTFGDGTDPCWGCVNEMEIQLVGLIQRAESYLKPKLGVDEQLCEEIHNVIYKSGNRKYQPLTDGLKKIQEVLNYATDSTQARYNVMVWVKDSVDALLQGKTIEIPPRATQPTTARL